MKGRCCIFANCQAHGLRHFLAKAAFPYEIDVYQNYQIILKEQSPDALREAASQCDLFIYQPTREMKHGELSSEFYIEEVIPKLADTLAFPYIYNTGHFPLCGHGDGIIGLEDLRDICRDCSKEMVLGLYGKGLLDFGLWPRFLACAQEQAKREAVCDVTMSDWMMDNRDKRILLTFNHPTSITFAALARRVFLALNLPDPGEIPWTHWNECNLPCAVPVSPYVIETFKWREQPDPEAHAYYRQLVEKAWDIINAPQTPA